MGAGAQIGALRHHAVGADGDGPQAVKFGMVADPGMIADRDFPGIGDARAGPHDDAAADSGAEGAQQETPPAIGELRRAGEQRALHDLPEKNDGRRNGRENWAAGESG